MAAQFPDEQTDEGDFERQEDAFRNWVSDDPQAAHPVFYRMHPESFTASSRERHPAFCGRSGLKTPTGGWNTRPTQERAF